MQLHPFSWSSFSRLAPYLSSLFILLTGMGAVVSEGGGGPRLRGDADNHHNHADLSQRGLQELREYAAQTGHIDPHVLYGHEAESGNMITPGYNSLGPSHVAAMEPGFDALANPVGMGGVGPGSITIGITVKEQQLTGEDGGGEE